MSIDSEDFKTFFEQAYGFEDISQTKCFKCGKTMQEKADKNGLVCVTGHTTSYLEYMTLYSSMLKEVFDSTDNFNFEKDRRVIKPIFTIYVGDVAIYVNEEIVRK